MTDYIKNPIAVSLKAFGKLATNDSNQLQGKALPCHVTKVSAQIVTVAFDINSGVQTLPQVVMPVFSWKYILPPVQVGDYGLAIPADVFTGGVTGLGSGTGDFTQQANLANLAFLPLANKSWTTPDPNAVVLKGVSSSGVIMQSGDGTVSMTLSASGVVFDLGGGTMTVNNGNIVVPDNDVIVQTTSFTTHIHDGVQEGAGVTEPPVVGS